MDGSVASRGENIVNRVENAEKEAAFFKKMAQISIAFTIGLVSGLLLMKRKK